MPFRWLHFLFLILFCSLLSARVFDVNTCQAYTNILLGGSLDLVNSYYNNNHVRSLTAEEVSRVKTSDVPFFDRWAIRKYSPDLDNAGTYLTLASLAHVAIVNAWDDPYTWDNFLVLSEVLIVQYSLANWTKSLTLRKRPFVYSDDTDLSDKLKKDARFSFYSNHTTLAFALAVYSHYYQHYTTRNPYIIASSYGLAGLVSLSRISAGAHFPTDIVTGMVVGSVSSYLICRSHRSKRSTKIIWGGNSVLLLLKF